MEKNYQYLNDGSLKYMNDQLDGRSDRLMTYDFASRLNAGKSSTEATGTTVTSNLDTQLPYRQSYAFNAFENMTQRNNLHWGVDSWYGQYNNLNYTYLNNRITNSGFTYDADGRNLQTAAPDDPATSTYNAAGQMVHSVSQSTDATRFYDGDWREIKRQTSNYDSSTATWVAKPTKYYIRSTVLGRTGYPNICDDATNYARCAEGGEIKPC